MNILKIILPITFSIVLYKILNRTLFHACEIEKCPYCFGTNLCDEFVKNNVVLTSNSLLELFSNYISVKNVFYGSYNNKSVVLKKLGHNFEIDNFDRNKIDLRAVSFNEEILSLLTSSGVNFKVCSKSAAQKFINGINEHSIDPVHFWTILKVNAEPLLLQFLKAEDGWRVPSYLGACGRLIVETHCGQNLNAFSNIDWYLRSQLALQLLYAVKNFTDGHREFRFYFTDISPDNVAIDKSLKLTFVDLENVVITDKTNLSLGVHFSRDFGEDFAFSEVDICGSSISDHNYFAVCKLLLSKEAPWPMMKGGLLHTPPTHILKKHFNLFTLIESCAQKINDINCFDAVDQIIFILEKL